MNFRIIISFIIFCLSSSGLNSKEPCPKIDPLTWTNCLGKKTNERGDKYEGEFLNGKYHGYGKYIFKDGEIYEGYFVNGKKHGKGKEIFKDGMTYEGDLFENFQHGQGTLILGNNKYIGSFKNGVRDGKGIQYFENGDTFSGEYQNNVRSGFGIFKKKDGSLTISGQFKEDLLNGKAKTIFSNGDILEGIYKDGELTPNLVTYTYKSGDKFIGDFDKELKHFQLKSGTYFHVNGDKYVGDFDKQGNKLNGVHYFANNTSAKITNGKSEWLNLPVLSSYQKPPNFSVESMKPSKNSFFSIIIGILSFFIIPIIMYNPVAYLLDRTKNELFKYGIILLSLIIFYVVLISIHDFIGFNIGGRCFPQLHRFSDC